MTIQELKQIHNEIVDQSTVISALSAQWYRALTIDERMKAAIDLENHANMLRIAAERLATGTRKSYTEESHED